MMEDRQDPMPAPHIPSANKQCQPQPPADSNAPVASQGNGEVDLDAWRDDVQRLHMSINHSVQAFIATQTRQIDAIASELISQKDAISAKERCFAELSDSIAGFVENEAARTEYWGLSLVEADADSRHEAYDAELPGPPALHRINRLWRKMTRAFEVMKEAKDRESSKVLGDERERLEALVAVADERFEALRCEHSAEVEALRLDLEGARSEGHRTLDLVDGMVVELKKATDRHDVAETRVAAMTAQLAQAGYAQNRAGYEWEAEREELIRERAVAQAGVEELQETIEVSQKQEAELVRQVAERGDKLEQMRRIMDEQEREMTVKIDRVQQYVKERQAGALVAEKKQKDAEHLADRWQREVVRLQTEKDRLGNVVLDLETKKSGQAQHFQGTHELHQQELSRLEGAMQIREEEMRSANMELLQQRDSEYQTKITHERQREKDRSIALLNKKQQEMVVKEQQLKAARQRIQELECSRPGASPSSSHGSSVSRRPPGDGRDVALPPLPLSAR